MNQQRERENRPITFLLVEDAPDQVRLMQEALISAAIVHRMEVASTGEEALKLLANRAKRGSDPQPDMVLLDLNLPGKSGHQVLSEIKSNPDLACIPVIILSSSQQDSDVARAYESHANCYITKPIGYNGLVDVVRSIAGFWFGLVRLPSHLAA